MVNHMREPIFARWFACCRSVRWQQDGDKRPIPIECVDVVVVHPSGGSHDPWIGCTGLRVPAPLGAKHRGLFLGLADEHNALIGGKLAQVFSHPIVLALSLTKLLLRYICLHNETESSDDG